MLAEFTARAEAVGVRIGRAEDGAAAATWVAEVADELETDGLLASAELLATAPELAAGIAAAGVEIATPAAPDEARDAPLGLSLGRIAIAETGSVLLAESTLGDRAIGLLSLAHVIVAPLDALVPSLDDAAPALREAARRPIGMATLVTGPSRTADIERVLTVGVQGPGRVFVLFVDRLD